MINQYNTTNQQYWHKWHLSALEDSPMLIFLYLGCWHITWIFVTSSAGGWTFSVGQLFATPNNIKSIYLKIQNTRSNFRKCIIHSFFNIDYIRHLCVHLPAFVAQICGNSLLQPPYFVYPKIIIDIFLCNWWHSFMRNKSCNISLMLF